MSQKTRPAAPPEDSVLRRLAALEAMTTDELRARWGDLFGVEPPRLSRSYLVRRLAYRIQELAYGGLSRETKDRLRQIAAGLDDVPRGKRPPANPGLTPGTRLVRAWRGQEYEVIVQDDGFLYAGERYRSLSAIAKIITGAHWNGNRFFGLKPPRRPK